MNKENKNNATRMWLGGGILIAIAAAGLLFMLFRQRRSLANDVSDRISAMKKGPVLKAVKAGMADGDKGLTLIGEARPFQTVTLYAKTSGYMNNISVDKGDRVRQGQLLATIVSPEVDQSYLAAVADLNNKQKILKRDQTLLQKQYISTEDEEQTATSVSMAAAQVRSLKEQMQYKNITAPFSGTITARYADKGALVQNATTSQTSAQPIVTLSQLDEIRIYVYVAQNDAAFLLPHYPVTITMTEKPDFKINASVTRIAGELDPKTRMMLVEIDLPNKDNTIIPGSYLQVNFAAPDKQDLTVPSEALIIRGKDYFIPVIGSDSTVHFAPVTIANNDGTRASVSSGINKGDLIGLNAGAELQEGQKVRIQL